MVGEPFGTQFSERFADPSTGRSIVVLRWDRGWTRVRAELPAGALPDVTDLTLFEDAGLAVPTEGGELIVRIDRAAHRPKFAVTLGGRPLVSLPEDVLSPLAAAELAAAAQPAKGSSARALLIGVGCLFGVFLFVTGAAIAFSRASHDRQPSTTGYPTPIILSPLVTIAPGDQTDRFLREKAVAVGALDPDAAVACMKSLTLLTEADVLEMRAPFRSVYFQCLPDELSRQWVVVATGLSPADEPCARKASVVGLGRLLVTELELIGPVANSTAYPVAIQDKLVLTVRELCPHIPADVAERIVKE